MLLQKTLLNIEGVGRQLYPQLDLWQTAKPFLERWVGEQKGPAALIRRLGEQAPEWIESLPELPMLLHGALRKLADAEQHREDQAREFEQVRQQLQRNSRRNAIAMTGGAFMLGGAVIYGLDGYQPILMAGAPLISWVMAGIGLLMLSAVLR